MQLSAATPQRCLLRQQRRSLFLQLPDDSLLCPDNSLKLCLLSRQLCLLKRRVCIEDIVQALGEELRKLTDSGSAVSSSSSLWRAASFCPGSLFGAVSFSRSCSLGMRILRFLLTHIWDHSVEPSSACKLFVESSSPAHQHLQRFQRFHLQHLQHLQLLEPGCGRETIVNRVFRHRQTSTICLTSFSTCLSEIRIQ